MKSEVEGFSKAKARAEGTRKLQSSEGEWNMAMKEFELADVSAGDEI